MRRSRVAIALLVPALLAPAAAPGQTPAWLESCYDGDTCTFGGVRDTAVTVRLAGIDTPEMDGQCRAAARRAKRALRRQLRSASVVRVKPVETGRYGRVIGRVYADTVDVSRWLKRRGLAVDYPGDTCPVSGAGLRERRDRGGALPYDPDGPDRDCGDFESRPVAQRFFEAAGGPAEDPHRLDGDDDGLACESLPGRLSTLPATSPSSRRPRPGSRPASRAAGPAGP